MRRTIDLRGGFTLIELLVVVAIMGMMGGLTVASYRAMRQGMEEKSVLQNTSQFLRLAYQRSRIDYVPVQVYYWNETRQVEDEDHELVAMGRAVAVRRSGRITKVSGRKIYDEFGDFDALRHVNEDGEIDDAGADNEGAKGMALYRVNGDETSPRRCLVGPDAIVETLSPLGMASYPKEADESSERVDSRGDTVRRFGLYVRDAGSVGTWRVGDAYGFEFAEIELPQGYLFSNASFDKSRLTDNFNAKLLRYDPQGGDDASSRINVSALRPNNNGVLDKVDIGSCEAPTENQDKQNQ